MTARQAYDTQIGMATCILSARIKRLAGVHSYRVSGLAVASEIDLPGLIPAPATPPDVIIRAGAVPQVLEGAHEIRPTYQIAGDRFLLRIPGIARFLLRGGAELTIAPENGTPFEDIAIFVIGTVFGILLHQREQVVLHASAVCVDGKAVLFCGPSGAGKSTMAAVLGKHGYAMLTDDVCAITTDAAGTLLAQPDGRQLKLWSSAVERLDLAARRGAPVRDKLEKFYVEPAAASAEALPVGAVYILRETRPSVRDGIEPLNLADAARLVRKNAYRPRLVRAMQQNAHYLRSAAAIADKAGFFFLCRRLEFAVMPQVVARLEEHWRVLGLLGASP